MYQRILVPIDGSPTATAGLDEAIRLAALTGAVLRLMHVLDLGAHVTGFETGAVYCNEVIPAARRAGARILDQAMQRVERNHLKADAALVETLGGRVSDRVVEQARDWDADLIVIGTHGRHGVERFMAGSHAEQVVRTAPVPVLLVRSKGEAGVPSSPGAAEPESPGVAVAPA